MKPKTEFEIRRMCSADAAVNATLTQHHEIALSDLGDTLMEMQNSAFTLGYLRAQNDAAAEVARLQALLDAVPVAALWRHWRASTLRDDHPYSRAQLEEDFGVIFGWFSTGWLDINSASKFKEEGER